MGEPLQQGCRARLPHRAPGGSQAGKAHLDFGSSSGGELLAIPIFAKPELILKFLRDREH